MLVFGKTNQDPLENEIFSFGRDSFDVYLAHNLVQTNLIPYTIQEIDPQAYLKTLGFVINKDKSLSENTTRHLFAGINWQHAANLHANHISQPGIMVLTEFGALLIDGNHRAANLAHTDKMMKVYYIQDKKAVAKITLNTSAYIKAEKQLKRLQVQASINIEGKPDGQMTIGDLHFDQRKGIGQVPFNEEIGYRGFAVLMTPNQFNRLTPAKDYTESKSLKYLKSAIKAGKSIGSPFLDVSFSGKVPNVMSHEGRTRMKAIEEVYGQVPVLVHIFPGNLRAKNITNTMIAEFRTLAIPQESKKKEAGPFFDRKVWHSGQWKNIDKPSPVEAAITRVFILNNSNLDKQEIFSNLIRLDVLASNLSLQANLSTLI